MYKIFCDICEKDITDYSESRFKAQMGRLTIEIMTAIDGTFNGGHVCEECVRKAVEMGSFKRKVKQ